MWKRFTLKLDTICNTNVLKHTDPLDNRNLWTLFQSAITWKQGITLSKFLYFFTLCLVFYHMWSRFSNRHALGNHVTDSLIQDPIDSISYFWIFSTLFWFFSALFSIFSALILTFFCHYFRFFLAVNWILFALNRIFLALNGKFWALNWIFSAAHMSHHNLVKANLSSL